MALIIKLKCPKCHSEELSKIDQMIRCTCGWWTQIDEENLIEANNYTIINISA